MTRIATITADTAVETLTAEGFTRDNAIAALDSLIESGLTVESDGEDNLITADELQVLRDQLNS